MREVDVQREMEKRFVNMEDGRKLERGERGSGF
jgi:hypothetical protein